MEGRINVTVEAVGEEREVRGITEESELSLLSQFQGKGKMRTYWLLGAERTCWAPINPTSSQARQSSAAGTWVGSSHHLSTHQKWTLSHEMETNIHKTPTLYGNLPFAAQSCTYTCPSLAWSPSSLPSVNICI